MHRDIVVIGASAGGIEALRTLAAALPPNFPASIFAVLHAAAESPGILAEILSRAGPLPALAVRTRERIRRGHIYVAAPDHHLIVDRDVVYATRGPKENRFRPAIDPLFWSAASSYGPRVVGAILTGGLDDGVAGLQAVQQLGGMAIIQDPRDALFSDLPQNALARVKADYVVPLHELGPLLTKVAAEPVVATEPIEVPNGMKVEVAIAGEDNALEAGVLTLGEPSNYTCPDCHGVLLQLRDERYIRFRCHTGHAFSRDSLVAAMQQRADEATWNAVRALEELTMLLRHVAGHATADGAGEAAMQRLLARATAAERHSHVVRRSVIDEWDPEESAADDPAADGSPYPAPASDAGLG